MALIELPVTGRPTQSPRRVRKIALEEHVLALTVTDLSGWAKTHANGGIVQLDWMSTAARRAGDLGSARLEEMDAAGIDVAVLSLTTDVLEILRDRASAVDTARRVNDFLAESKESSNGRYEAFASVPLQDVDAAIRELERGVRELGCCGVMVNGYVTVPEDDLPHYLDEPQFDAFWEALADLGVPLYLHPRTPVRVIQETLYRGHPELVEATWGYGPETATHALRLVYSGVFDRHPKAELILGHLGETIPFFAWRIQHCYEYNPLGTETAKRLQDYLAENIWVTTSGNCSDQALITVLLTVGANRVMFATDYPYEMAPAAARWIESAPIGESNRRRVCWDNAAALLNISR